MWQHEDVLRLTGLQGGRGMMGEGKGTSRPDRRADETRKRDGGERERDGGGGGGRGYLIL